MQVLWQRGWEGMSRHGDATWDLIMMICILKRLLSLESGDAVSATAWVMTRLVFRYVLFLPLDAHRITLHQILLSGFVNYRTRQSYGKLSSIF